MVFEMGERDIKAIELMEETTRKLRKEGRQVLMIADNFQTPKGYNGNVLSAEIDKKGNGVTAMLVDLINGIYSSKGIKFATVYEFLGREAKARGLM